MFAIRRRTKILATLGPASDGALKMEELLRAGVDLFRLNFSHGDHAGHAARIAAAREAEKSVGRPIALLADLHEAGAESTIAQMRAVMNRPDQRAMIRGLMLNALVVVGSDDPLIPIEDARATAQAIADARFEALPGAGHLIPWEQPSELAALIRDWIRQTINEARAMSFADTLKSLPPITHLAALELLDAGGSTVAVIENKPGKAGSLAVYSALAARHGKIDPAAAREGLELFAEHTADARANPGKHPNIDRLIEVIESGTVLGVRTVAL